MKTRLKTSYEFLLLHAKVLNIAPLYLGNLDEAWTACSLCFVLTI